MKNKLPLIWKNIFQAQGFLGREVSKKSQMYSDGQKLESGSVGVSNQKKMITRPHTESTKELIPCFHETVEEMKRLNYSTHLPTNATAGKKT